MHYSAMFDPRTLVSTLILHFTLLLTFGLLSPPVALCALLGIIVETLFWQAALGRYVYLKSCKSDVTGLFVSGGIKTGSVSRDVIKERDNSELTREVPPKISFKRGPGDSSVWHKRLDRVFAETWMAPWHW